VQKFGLRTGIEIKTVNDALASYDEAVDAATAAGTAAPARNSEQAAAEAQLQDLAAALALDTASTRFFLDQSPAIPTPCSLAPDALAPLLAFHRVGPEISPGATAR
jgi:hypothetical protein